MTEFRYKTRGNAAPTGKPALLCEQIEDPEQAMRLHRKLFEICHQHPEQTASSVPSAPDATHT